MIVTRDGWVKRQKEVKDLGTTRLREGDAVLAVVAGSTRATIGVLHELRRGVHVAHHGCARVHRIRRADSESVQVQGRREGGRRPEPGSARVRATSSRRTPKTPAPVHALAVSSDGYSLRFSLQNFVEPSTRAGRRFGRVPDGAEFVGVVKCTGEETIIAATRQARAMLCQADEINFLSGPGRGVILIKLQKEDDRLLGFIASDGDRDLMTVETSARRRADDQHREVRRDRPRRQGPRAASARRIHRKRGARRRLPQTLPTQ